MNGRIAHLRNGGVQCPDGLGYPPGREVRWSALSGIGGLFFRARDPESRSRWYAGDLGVQPAPESYDVASWWQQAGPTVFSPFPAYSEDFERPEQHSLHTPQPAIRFRLHWSR
jgi:hypothetical protein